MDTLKRAFDYLEAMDLVMPDFGCQLDILGSREPQLRNYLHHVGLWSCVDKFSWSLIDVYRQPVHCEDAVPSNVVLGYIRKASMVTEQARGSKWISSGPLWCLPPCPCPDFLYWWPLTSKLEKPFPSLRLCQSAFGHSNKKQTRTGILAITYNCFSVLFSGIHSPFRKSGITSLGRHIFFLVLLDLQSW